MVLITEVVVWRDVEEVGVGGMLSHSMLDARAVRRRTMGESAPAVGRLIRVTWEAFLLSCFFFLGATGKSTIFQVICAPETTIFPVLRTTTFFVNSETLVPD